MQNSRTRKLERRRARSKKKFEKNKRERKVVSVEVRCESHDEDVFPDVMSSYWSTRQLPHPPVFVYFDQQLVEQAKKDCMAKDLSTVWAYACTLGLAFDDLYDLMGWTRCLVCETRTMGPGRYCGQHEWLNALSFDFGGLQ